jgi:hypothetical protein
MPWNSWEVFDPRDGEPIHVTDCEDTARQIKGDHPGWDYAPAGMEAGASGWVPWRRDG